MKFLTSLILLASSTAAVVLDPSETSVSVSVSHQSALIVQLDLTTELSKETYVPNKWIVEYSSGGVNGKRSFVSLGVCLFIRF